MSTAPRTVHRLLRGAALLATCALALGGCAHDAEPVTEGTGGSGAGASRDATAGGESTATAVVCRLEPVFFPYDSSDLDEAARSSLERDARCLKTDRSRSVVVSGMTDPRGTEEYNLALGERRAQAAKLYLARLGVEDARIAVTSTGEELATGEDESGWVRDRRAELHD